MTNRPWVINNVWRKNMYRKLSLNVIPVSIVLLALGVKAVEAQGQPNNVQNEANKIQYDAQSGMLNSKQTNKLESKESKIMQQEQADLNKNGGNLTGREERKLNRESRRLDRHIDANVDETKVRKDLPGGNSSQNQGYPSMPPAGENPNYQQAPQGGQYNPNYR